nr:MAG TPA: hypothetical protein [Caudoviricetes sp.]
MTATRRLKLSPVVSWRLSLPLLLVPRRSRCR